MSLMPLAGQRWTTRQSLRISIPPFLLVVVFVVSGCASGPHGSVYAEPPVAALHRRCEAPPSLQRTRSDPSVPELSRQSSRGHPAPAAALELSTATENLAEIMEASDLIGEIAAHQASEGHTTERGRIRDLELRQHLYDRLLLTSFEIDNVTAEGACEQARADRLMDRLQDILNYRVRTQTIIAVVGGAMVGVLAGG